MKAERESVHAKMDLAKREKFVSGVARPREEVRQWSVESNKAAILLPQKILIAAEWFTVVGGPAKYEQAEYIERELEQMTEQIKAIIQTVNANQGGELDAADGMQPLDVVVRILNNQLSSLMWIDDKAEEFSSRIQKLANQGSAADRELLVPKLRM